MLITLYCYAEVESSSLSRTRKTFFLIPFCRISIYFLCLLYRLDCKTVGFFLEVSNSASFETFCLTARAYLNPGLAYAKIRTVLQSTLWPTGRRNRICSYKFIDVFFFCHKQHRFRIPDESPGFWRCPADQKARRLLYNIRPTTVKPMWHVTFKIIEIGRFVLWAAILHECQNYLGGGPSSPTPRAIIPDARPPRYIWKSRYSWR